MSRSKRKPIIKDRPRNRKKSTMYWRRIRRNHRNSLKSYNEKNYDDFNLEQPKTIFNDYDYSDYKIYSNDQKYTRK